METTPEKPNNDSTTSMVFYESYMLAAQEAELNAEEKNQFYEGLMRYAFYKQLPNFQKPVMRGMFSAMKISIDNNSKKLQRQRAARENGKKGGAPKGNKNAAKTIVMEVLPDENPSAPPVTPDVTLVTKQPNETTQKSPGEAKQPIVTTISNYNSNYCSNSSYNTNSVSLSLSHTKEDEKEEREKEERELITGKKYTNIQDRNAAFYKSLLPYVAEFGPEHIRSFYEYWVEPTQNKTQLRFETQIGWDLETRLRRWKTK